MFGSLSCKNGGKVKKKWYSSITFTRTKKTTSFVSPSISIIWSVLWLHWPGGAHTHARLKGPIQVTLTTDFCIWKWFYLYKNTSWEQRLECLTEMCSLLQFILLSTAAGCRGLFLMEPAPSTQFTFRPLKDYFGYIPPTFIRFVKREMTSREVQYPVYTDNIVSTVHGTEWLAEPSGCLQTDKINYYCCE